MGEAADFFFFNILIISINGVFHVLPFQLRNGDALALAQHGDGAFLFIIAHQPSDLTIKESLFGCGVVFDKHHLCPDFQLQFFLGGVGVFRKGAVYFCLESQRLLLDCSQFRLVDLVGLVVVGGQGDVAFFVIGHEARFEATIEHPYAIGIHLVVAYLVQQ